MRKTDYEKAKARTLKEYNKLQDFYNEAIAEGDEEDANDFQQQIYAIQRILKVAFNIII